MIEKISALRTMPTRIRKFVQKKPVVQANRIKQDDVLKDKLSYIIHAEQHETFDPFMTEHFDYLRYLGVND